MIEPSYMAVTYETLDQAHADLQSASAAIADNIQALEGVLDNLPWTGQAATQYQGVKNQWTNLINDMNGVLAAAYMHIEKMCEVYREVEQRNTNIWS